MWQSLKEHFALSIVYGRFKWFIIKDWFFDLNNYYSYFGFFKIDLFVLVHYLFRSPFLISKRFLLKKGEPEVYTYGETPLRVYEKIARTIYLNQTDTFIELGSGRGRGCLWLSIFVKCKVLGIDYVPYFISVSNKAARYFDLKNIDFKREDFFVSDLSQASVIYFYALCLSEEEIQKMISRFEELSQKTIIVTVSFSLRDYMPSCSYLVFQSLKADFPWGEGEVFFQVQVQHKNR